ncbi:jg13804 [Pararge aegeria aegeria]|uniref:Jg13804 protein n=2 Tax=Pararge aegeria TaxID=116150 RepID=A0A8S4S4E6_9NEOP|nr:jg13804 [Pararge aegeria aegeria]
MQWKKNKYSVVTRLAPAGATLQEMQPTLPAIWSEIEQYRRRRGRVTLAELSEITARAHQMHLQELRRLRELHARLEWQRVHRPEIVVYTPGQLRQHIRLGNSAEDSAGAAQPTSSTVWRPGPLGAQWHLPDNDQMTETGKTSATGADGEWSVWKSARGWGAGALLLIAALLLVRATDRCFTRNYARSRRRRSEEWPTPNVLATSHRLPISVEPEISPNEFELYPSESSDTCNDAIFNADLPPPYSECASDANKNNNREEPPPPYSECYVAFSNPKNGTPSVRFLNSQQQNIFVEDMATTTRYINVQTSTEELTEIAHSSNGFNHIDTGQIPHNPIGDRIHRIPYIENAAERDDESENCNGNCIMDSLECINVGPAPLATDELSIDTEDDITIEIYSCNESSLQRSISCNRLDTERC